MPIEHAVIEEYGNDDLIFDNTSQKSNPWIFRIKNVLGEHYFAADNELMMKEWIHHLNLAIGSKINVINKVTKGGIQPSDTSETGSDENGNPDEHSLVMAQRRQPQHGGYLDDDYLESNDNNNNNNPIKPIKPKRGNVPQIRPNVQQQPRRHSRADSRNSERYKMQQPRGVENILQMLSEQQQGQNHGQNHGQNGMEYIYRLIARSLLTFCFL